MCGSKFQGWSAQVCRHYWIFFTEKEFSGHLRKRQEKGLLNRGSAPQGGLHLEKFDALSFGMGNNYTFSENEKHGEK